MPLIDKLTQILESMWYADVTRYHFQQTEAEAVDVVFVRLFLVFEQNALMDLWLLGVEQRNLSHTDVTDFDVSVIWIDVNGFTSQFAVD